MQCSNLVLVVRSKFLIKIIESKKDFYDHGDAYFNRLLIKFKKNHVMAAASDTKQITRLFDLVVTVRVTRFSLAVHAFGWAISRQHAIKN